MIIQGFFKSIIFPCMELFVIFQVFHDLQSSWEPWGSSLLTILWIPALIISATFWKTLTVFKILNIYHLIFKITPVIPTFNRMMSPPGCLTTRYKSSRCLIIAWPRLTVLTHFPFMCWLVGLLTGRVNGHIMAGGIIWKLTGIFHPWNGWRQSDTPQLQLIKFFIVTVSLEGQGHS